MLPKHMTYTYLCVTFFTFDFKHRIYSFPPGFCGDLCKGNEVSWPSSLKGFYSLFLRVDKQVEASGRCTMQVVVYDGVVVKYMLYKYMLYKYMLHKYLLHELDMNLTSYEV